VETREQFQRLKSQQCSEGQGNYFHMPVAGKEFAKLRDSDLSSTVAAAQ
jgi:EAL domain-containing protein (putative c-di-GMP-specific phosphodiesterase class I)